MNTVDQAAARMRGLMPEGINTYWQFMSGAGGYETRQVVEPWDGYRVGVTDCPKDVYGEGRLYTVTSALAVKTLEAGGKLLPPVLHREHGVRTHKGLGLPLVLRFFECLIGPDILGGKDYFLWMGHQIDPEQFRIENMIASMGPDVSQRIASLFFDPKSDLDRRPLFLGQQVEQIIKLRGQGESLANYPELWARAEEILGGLAQLTGLRSGWYILLRESLLGEKGDRLAMDPFAIKLLLELVLEAGLESKKHDGPSQAVVLEIDTKRLFSQTGGGRLYPVLFDNRDPLKTVPAVSIGPEAVVRVLAANPAALRSTVFEVVSIEELDKKNFLGHSRPSDFDVNELDPSNPCCSLRYSLKPDEQVQRWRDQRGALDSVSLVKLWREHLMAGRIAPLQPIYPGQFGSESLDQFLLHVFGPEIITGDSDRDWDLYGGAFSRFELSRLVLPGIIKGH